MTQFEKHVDSGLGSVRAIKPAKFTKCNPKQSYYPSKSLIPIDFEGYSSVEDHLVKLSKDTKQSKLERKLGR